jgi:hypothetical protein
MSFGRASRVYANGSINEQTPLILSPEDTFSSQDLEADTFEDHDNTPVNESITGEGDAVSVSPTLVVSILTFGLDILVASNQKSDKMI